MSAAAAALGLRRGARLADARAAVPGLLAEPADPDGDRAALGAMALWARRWCPWTAADGDHDGPGEGGLVLDLTGSAHLLGGDAAALADVEARLGALGYAVRAAVAPTRGAAWALARHGGTARIVHDAETIPAALAGLPARALRLDADDARALAELGLGTVGALAALPRAALERRFRARRKGPPGPVPRLDQALGRVPEPVAPPAEPPRFLARARLAEPVLEVAPLLPGLAADLALALERAGRGARRLRLTVFRADGSWREAEVATAAATRDAAHIVRLLGTALGRVDPGFGLDAALLEAPRTEGMAPRQARLGGGPDPDRDLAALIDRLATRFGRDAVAWAAPQGSHLPERAERRVPALAGPPPAWPEPGGPARPLRLFERPEPLRVIYALPEGPPLQLSLGGPGGRAAFRVARHAGPERVAPEWWRAAPGTRLRDYWQAELEDGRRLWVYREGLHGDGRGGAPGWFLHGLLA